MANLQAIHSVGNSLTIFLRNAYGANPSPPFPSCEFRLLSSGEFAEIGDITTTLSLYLYRVTINEHLRTTTKLNNLNQLITPLSIDLHYLLTVWADNALAEHTIFAWAMRHLHLHQMLDASSLTPEANWSPADIVHLIPAELSNEDTMRIWDALEPNYRLSFSYIARVVRIDPDTGEDSLPVVATRLTYIDKVNGTS